MRCMRPAQRSKKASFLAAASLCSRSAAVLEKLRVSEDEKWGVNIIKRVAEEPLRRIAINAGVEGSIALQKVKEGKGAFGFNAAH